MAVSVAALRRILSGENPVAELRALVAPRPRPTPAAVPQLRLWVVDGDGLPERPWRVRRDTVVECLTLGSTREGKRIPALLPAHVCVARQLASECQRTKDTWRGEASAYPSCVTERCAQGRGIREALDPDASVKFRGAGPGGRFERGRKDVAKQHAAKARLRAKGLLEDVRVLDVDPDPVESEE
jgi:hypothetical protein